jgi:hypothetical protein
MPKLDIDYSNTIIYKITCIDPNITDVYVGHTTNFVQRKHAHKQSCTNQNIANYKCKLYDVIRNNGGWENWKMEIINFYNCYDHYEARKKEQEYFISLNATLNSIEPLPKPKPKPEKTPEQKESLNIVLEKKVFYCEKCNINCDSLKLLEIHNETKKHNKTAKHKMNIITNYAQKFNCDICDYKTCKKSSYDNHLLSAKHEKNMNDNKMVTNDNALVILKKCECECGKQYTFYSGLSRHKKNCIGFSGEKETEKEKEIVTVTSNPINTELIIELLKQNQEFKSLIADQNKHILELMEKGIGNTTNMNCNNVIKNKFNLNIFLNEQCKDAMNIMDFVNSLQLQLSDLERVGELGYVKGISHIVVNKLKALDICKRPIHCSDLKRETMYVKDENAWEKENGKNEKITKMIKHVAHKNQWQINEWRQENPEHKNPESVKCDKYLAIVNQSMGGSTEDDDINNYNKIIKNIAKEVIIDKDSE